MAIQEFQTAAELKAHHAALKQKFANLKPPTKVIPITASEPKSQPVPVLYPQCKVFYIQPPVERVFRASDGPPTFDEIIAEVCRFYRLTPSDLRAARRNADVLLPRQVAMYLARTMAGLSSSQIGRRLGNRDHTTVLSAQKKIEYLRIKNERLQDEIDILRMILAERVSNRKVRVSIA